MFSPSPSSSQCGDDGGEAAYASRFLKSSLRSFSLEHISADLTVLSQFDFSDRYSVSSPTGLGLQVEMKVNVFLPVAFAFTAVAELQLYPFPTPIKRDVAAISSVASLISDAITKLDTSVKAFGKDGTQVQSDAENLAKSVTDGAKTIASSPAGAISLADLSSLQQTVVSPLTTASANLLADLESKKGAFEAAGLCGSFESIFKSISAEVQGLVCGITSALPQEAQALVSQQLQDLTGKLTQCGDVFQQAHCTNQATTSSTSVVLGYPTALPVTSSSSSGETLTTSIAETSSVATTTTSSVEATTTTITTTTAETTLSATSQVLTTTTSAEVTTSVVASCPVLSAPTIITQIAVTVTVTAPCACDTAASTSSSTQASVSTPLLTQGGGAPYPTGSNSTATFFFPTGGATTSPLLTALPTGIPTGAAVSNYHKNVGAAGLIAGIAAALFV
ncbi:hypothetical protein F5Y17DRAFT_417161 [Xylariaceae sp. FL0594]|nr:hypothetical protein F5Y17DRAFT_417161 [Xylariaceae sp. FL0594]